MNFIKKAADNRIDESVHLQFQKFSKGEFRQRALIEAKNSNGKYTIKTSAEFANELVRTMSEKLGNNKTKVTGSIIGTNDLKGILEFKKISQFQGVKNYSVEKEMSGTEIISLLDKFPKNFFALSFSFGDDSLKIKPKAPKSGKPSSKGGNAPKVDFCVLKTSDSKLAEEFVFEDPLFKEARISHDFIINELIFPKGEKDFAAIRELAKRKGKIIRKAVIDGKNIEKELSFEA